MKGGGFLSGPAARWVLRAVPPIVFALLLILSLFSWNGAQNLRARLVLNLALLVLAAVLLCLLGRAARELQRGRAELRVKEQAIGASVSAIVISDLEPKIVYANPAFLRLLRIESEEKVLGRSPLEFWGDPEQAAEATRTLRDGSGWEGEMIGKRSDGSLFEAYLSAGLVRSERGRPTHLMASCLDITAWRRAERERRLLERQMQQAQKLESLGVLAGGIAHDFNNILTTVLGNTELARQLVSPVHPAAPHLKETEGAALRAAELCRQMLAYSGKGRFQIVDVNLSELIGEMTHLLEVSVSKTATLRYHLSPGLPPVRADVFQIRQVIMNLVTNASEAIGEKSGIINVLTGTLHCTREYLRETWLDEDLPDGLFVFVEVSDNGCGMDELTRDRLFDPFFTTKFTGRGLGLAATLGIVRGHRGAIKVYSEPDRGSTFKLLLPAAEGAVAAAHSDPQPSLPWKGSGTVLLADDEPSILRLASRMLERMGFTVLTAADGQQALETYRSNAGTVDCVILDLTMPRLTGEEAFRALRRLRPDLPVLLASGYNEQEVTQRFAGKGLTGFLQKPFRLSELTEKLRGILG